MRRFDRFADWVAHVWASPGWFSLCAVFVFGWVAGMFAMGTYSDPNYHLWLNSPTTALTFLGVFLLHNSTTRFENAANQRLHDLEERMGEGDPVQDEGQRPDVD